ncbi:MAG: RluA family pseudouridine synthase [Clostridia bacterium]
MELKYIVKKNDYKNINEILTLEFKCSTRLITKLIKNKKIYKNNKIADTRDLVSFEDIIYIDLNLVEDNSNIIPRQMKLDIIYEDEWMVLVNKPAGIPIHPSRLHYIDSLSNGIKFYFDSIGLAKKIRPVNRLDLDTSGLVIFAKCEYIQEAFVRQMTNKTFQKEYLCFVNGILKQKIGMINLPIARKSGSIIERCIDKNNGHPSITHYEVIREFQNYSLVQCKLETGRTHQIRVHMQAIGHPIIGDTLYGNKSPLIDRQALHSYQIQCIHPVTKEKLNFIAKLPKDMEVLLK